MLVARRLVQHAVRDARALRRKHKQEYKKAQAAASLKTTLRDFLRFARASLGALDDADGTGGVLSIETLQLMQQPVSPSDNYGLGYSVSEAEGIPFAGHGGANKGWMAQLEVTPGRGHGRAGSRSGCHLVVRRWKPPHR